MDVYEVITDRIIKKLEEGTVPWHKPWGGDGPRNLISKKEYQGINFFMTACAPYESTYWITFKQAKEIGANIKKGEHGTPIVYWNWIERKAQDHDDDSDEAQGKMVPFLRYYTAFNLDQCENIPEKWIPPKPEQAVTDLEKIAQCEKTVDNMPNKPALRHEGSAAYYQPLTDTVTLPSKNSFFKSEEYYSTMFHELVHSTGHESRLNRKGVAGSEGEWSVFGSKPYAEEELTAEMGATFLCAHNGIENQTIDNSASYVASWLTRLRNDKKLVVVAAARAQRATNYILGKSQDQE